MVDIARKVVGVGSVGTRAWIVLLLGRDGSDPLFLQAKEAQPSVLESFTGASRSQSNGAAHRRRPAPDAGEQRHLPRVRDGGGYRRREARLLPAPAPRREGISDGGADGSGDAWRCTARSAGAALARAHARSGDRIAIAAYLGSGDTFDQAIADFSETYADQNERDYDALVAAEADGRVSVLRGL